MRYYLIYFYYLLHLHKIFKKSITVSQVNLNFYINLPILLTEKYRLNLFDKIKFDFKKINTVLDFGAGLGVDIGILTTLNKSMDLYLYDIDQNALLYAKRSNEIIFKKKVHYLDRAQMNFMLSKNKFDLIYTNGSLIYLTPNKIVEILKKFIASKPKLIVMHELSKSYNLKEPSKHDYYLHDFEKILKSLKTKYVIYKSSKPGFPHSVYGKIIVIYL